MRLRADYGDIASVDRQTVFVNSYALVATVLRAPARQLAVDRNFLGHRLSGPDRAELARCRALLNPSLRPAATTAVPDVAARLAESVLNTHRQGSGLDVMAVAEHVIAGTIGRHFFGRDAQLLARPVRDLLDALEGVIGNIYVLPGRWLSPAQRRVDRAYRRLRPIVDDLLASRRAAGSVDDVAGQVVGAAGTMVSAARLADLLIGALLAAQRVPAAAASWTLKLVGDHPDVQDGLRSEAARFAAARLSQRVPPMAAYPLTLAAIRESLRLYPPTWLITRSVLSPIVLGGYELSPGSTVAFSPYVIHRDASLFPDPARFAPARWCAATPSTSVYLPFGRGRHRCPGADLATTGIASLVLTILNQYELLPGPPAQLDCRATLRPIGLRIPAVGRQAAVRSRGAHST